MSNDEIRVSKTDKRNINRMIAVIICVVVLGILAAWKSASLFSGKSSESEGGVQISGKVNQLPEGRTLTTSSSNDVAKIIAERNAKNQEKANRSNSSAVDRLFDGEETIESQNELGLDLILKRLEKIEGDQESMRDSMSNLQYNTSAGRSSKKADIPHYIGLDGVTYMSDQAIEEEKTAMAKLWKTVEKSREVNLDSRVSGLRQGTAASASQQDAINRVGRNGQFTRLNGVSSSPSTRRTDQRSSNQSEYGGASTDIGQSNRSSTATYEAIPVTGLQEIAQLDLKLNSDIGGPVQATILSGRFQGAVLYANTFGVDRQYITINFKRFCLPRHMVSRNTQNCGRINAYAVDLGESVAAVKGKYRGHYAIRLLGATGAAFVSGLGRAYSTNLDPNQIITQTNVVQVPRREIGREEAANAALLEVGTSLAQTIREITQRNPTTSVRVNKNIGVLIMSPGVISPRASTSEVLDFGDEGIQPENLDSPIQSILNPTGR